MKNDLPPPVEIEVSASQFEHLAASAAYASAASRRELDPVFVALEGLRVRGAARGTLRVPCYSVPPLLAAFEAYAMGAPLCRAISNLHAALRAAESASRRVARDWARGELSQGSLL